MIDWLSIFAPFVVFSPYHPQGSNSTQFEKHRFTTFGLITSGSSTLYNVHHQGKSQFGHPHPALHTDQLQHFTAIVILI